MRKQRLVEGQTPRFLASRFSASRFSAYRYYDYYHSTRGWRDSALASRIETSVRGGVGRRCLAKVQATSKILYRWYGRYSNGGITITIKFTIRRCYSTRRWRHVYYCTGTDISRSERLNSAIFWHTNITTTTTALASRRGRQITRNTVQYVYSVPVLIH